ncbi:MAG: serine/threonine-protein kinase [Deltaproteobacteria bacterium]|nr:serine/threonine-protein kinase [Deltaproteobacteria bacterium]
MSRQPAELASSGSALAVALGDDAAVAIYKPGDRLGDRYRLQRLLGQGASGQVWQAIQEPLGRTVAVKVQKADAKGRASMRFLQEARIAGKLQSRYVVSLFDFGNTSNGSLYMVMEHLEGETLGARLMRAPELSVKELLRFIGQALIGLQEVHNAGIVHRDLKPDNIFLVTEKQTTYAKILDFGVSRAQDMDFLGADLSKLTGTGMTVGTPLFMAPEQARGLRDQLDGRTDLYALGVILFKALAGRPPFADANVVDLLMAVVAATVAPSVKAVRKDVPWDLSAAIQKAMAPKREDRFVSADEMRVALEAIEQKIPATLLCRWTGRSTLASTEDAAVARGFSTLVPPTDMDATMPQSLLSMNMLRGQLAGLPTAWVIAAVATLAAAAALGIWAGR